MGGSCSTHGRDEIYTKFWSENLKGRGHTEYRGVYGRTTLDIRLGGYGLDSSGSGKGPVAGSCEHGNESSGPINCREFLD
jgi:hypothetical protein